MNGLHLIVCFQILLCSSEIKTEEPVEKFEYHRDEPGNGLGIYTKVIAHIFRAADKTTDEWRLNREYLLEADHDSLVEQCQIKEIRPEVSWRGCISDKEGIFVFATWGVPEPTNKTVTYLEVEFKPFKTVNDDGIEEMCILEEVYEHKVYIMVRTFSKMPGNDTVPRNHIDSVAYGHNHQLDSFGEHVLSMFGKNIDPKLVYEFGKDEYFDRDPPYECFLSIGTSETTSVIKEKCDFYCIPIKGMDEAEVVKMLYQAKDEARLDWENDGLLPFQVIEDTHDEL